MNIIIDIRMIEKEVHGIGRYTYELVNGILGYKDIKLKLITNNKEDSSKLFKDSKGKIEFLIAKSKFLSPMEILEIPIIINKYKKDHIFHAPSFSCSPFIKLESYITIHDLNHLALPQYYSKLNKYYYRFAVKPFASKCKKIFTVSNFSKSEIIKWLGCNNDKVVVTYNGVDKKFNNLKANENDLNRIKSKYRLPNKFILYIGNLKAHKNVETIIKAMKNVDKEFSLIINGKVDKEFNTLINDYGLNNRITFIGYVDEGDLPYLYKLAKVFVYPSLYEGFGLPPLEAMACGCGTIVADSSCLKEVVGDGAIAVSAKDFEKFAIEINNIINNRYDNIVKNGVERSKFYNWDKLVKETFQIYKEE